MARNNDLFFAALKRLKNDIIDNKYPFQSKLPSETTLAENLNISRTTLRKVLATLREEGFIESRKGDGSYVCNKNIIRYIPIIISDNNSDFRKMEIIKGIQDYLDNAGFTSLLTFVESQAKKEAENIIKLVNNGHKNIIVYPISSNTNSFFYQEMLRKNVNFVFVDTLPNKITCDYVTSCNFLGGYDATKKLIELGHKNIAFCTLSDPSASNTVAERYAGYISALEQHKLTVEKNSFFVRNNLSNDAFGDCIVNNLTSTAIFASTDELAVILANKFANVDNPPAIIGFDNSVISQNIHLASINQNFYEIGRTAAELLHKRIINPTKNYEHIYIPVSLVERNSLFTPTIDKEP